MPTLRNMKPILEIRNIGKKYRIQHLNGGYISLRERIANALKFERNNAEDFWALENVSFDVQPGESIGIIGRNGAGKSTLLKILSKITPPSTGQIVSRGRIASLLEVGTGFHPELTGRENIFFNGSLLGMKRKEIESKFDEIVDFSDVEKFIDTPLKHFSSGMQLRLAFAVAAFLEPEILVIDEVLAVGDAEFQRKCLKKMDDVNSHGRTVLFVSHNLPSLKAVCRSGILLRNGQLSKQGSIDEVVDEYVSSFHVSAATMTSSIHYFQPHIKIYNLAINHSQDNSHAIDGRVFDISFEIEFFKRTPFELDIHLKKDELAIASYANFVNRDVMTFDPGIYRMEYHVELPPMRSGRYKMDLYFTEPFVSWFAVTESIIDIHIINDTHHTFLNNSTLKWGTTLLNGSVSREKIK